MGVMAIRAGDAGLCGGGVQAFCQSGFLMARSAEQGPVRLEERAVGGTVWVVTGETIPGCGGGVYEGTCGNIVMTREAEFAQGDNIAAFRGLVMS